MISAISFEVPNCKMVAPQLYIVGAGREFEKIRRPWASSIEVTGIDIVMSTKQKRPPK